MEINLSNVPFQDIFQAAIMQALDQNKKDELIKGALSHLMTRANPNGYSTETNLQVAFQNALRAEAIEVIREYLKTNPEFVQMIFGLIQDAVKKITEDARDKTVSNIADNIIKGLYSDRY